MLGDGIGVAAGLVEDKHACLGAGGNIDGVEPRTVGRDDQEVRRALQEILVDMKVPRQLVACRANLVGVRRRQDRREHIRRAFILEPIEPHVGAAFHDLGIDVVGEVFDVEHALVVDGH